MAWGRKVGMKRGRVLAKGLGLLRAGCGNVPVIWRSLRRPISPLAGEMPGRAEGGIDPASVFAASPPSVTYGDISPARGEIGERGGFTFRHAGPRSGIQQASVR
ncbi:hypothetical protein IMCC20628_00637 [Hoeflea sp. IMCC20628]|nr:hypothetical protein IMCC20628_00637 [Hoeflea sp. IMCC20628]